MSPPTRRYDGLDLLQDASLWEDRGRLLELLGDVPALIVRNRTRVDEEILSAAPSLRVIGRLGVGLDNVDVGVAADRGVQVVYAPDATTVAVAEYCLAQIINVTRMLSLSNRSTRAGHWERNQHVGRELGSLTIGIVGYGRTGRAVAKRLRALGAHVLVCTRRPERASVDTVVVDLETLLSRSDVVSLHVPGDLSTWRLLDSVRLASMKPGAALVNASRGGIVDEHALLASLQSGHLSAAVLDVRESEPPARTALEELPQVVLTPHIAAFTEEAQQRVSDTVLSDVLRVLSGHAPECPAPSY